MPSTVSICGAVPRRKRSNVVAMLGLLLSFGSSLALAGAAAAVQADQAGGQSKGGYSPCRPRRVRERGEEMLFFINLILNIKNCLLRNGTLGQDVVFNHTTYPLR